MTRPSTLPSVADPCRAVPAHTGTRVDAIEAALCALADEERRLQRLGLDGPRERCREARRFWGFVGAIYHLADRSSVPAPPRRAKR